jgi:segregation and condensation protein A
VQVVVDPAAVPAVQAVVEPGFHVHLDVFDGPFDLLLSLIAKRRLDVTLVAIAQVTDEFIGYIRASGEDWDLDQASEFLVVAATLLDLKVARLLPSADLDDEDDLALLEARDLLFARLLQYRAYKEATAWFTDALEVEAMRHPRRGSLEERHRPPAPPPEVPLDLAAFAALAASALVQRVPPTVGLDHLHAPVVSMRAEAAHIAALLKRGGAMSFVELAGDAADRHVVVARFLAVLELHRQGAVVFEQLEPLGVLLLRWSAADWDETALDRLGDPG